MNESNTLKLLDKEILNRVNDISKMEPGSEEHRNTHDEMIDLINAKNDMMQEGIKSVNDFNNNKLRRRNELIISLASTLGILLGVILKIKGNKDQLEFIKNFEQYDMFSSNDLKQLNK